MICRRHHTHLGCHAFGVWLLALLRLIAAPVPAAAADDNENSTATA